MENSKINILLVEDNPGDARLLRAILEEPPDLDCLIVTVETLEGALIHLTRDSFNVVLLDLSLPDSWGLDTFQKIHEDFPGIPIVVITGMANEKTAVQAVRRGAQDYLVKGQIDHHLLTRSIRYAIERSRIETELRRSNRALTVISECNQAVVHAEDETGLLNHICRIIIELGGYRMAWVGYAQQDRDKTVRPVAQAGLEEGYLKTAPIVWSDAPSGCGPTGRAIRSGQPVVGRNFCTNSELSLWRQEAVSRGFLSSIALPLIFEGKCFGALNIYAGESDAFEEKETHLLMEMADDLAFGIMTIRMKDRQRQAEKALQQSNELLERVFSGIHLMIAYLDPEFHFIRVNRAYAEADDREPEFFPGKNHFDLYPNPENEAIFRRVVETGEPYIVYEKSFVYTTNPEQGITYWDWSLQPVKDQNGQVVGLVFSLLNVTERKRLEKEILGVSRREQRRIGQDLHDVLGQNLTGLAFMAKILEGRLKEKSLPEAKDAAKIAKFASESINQARALARGLCPVDLKADGLMTALQELSANIQELFGIRCLFECEQPILIRDHNTATHLYHIAQEAISNAVKHGKGEEVTISLLKSKNNVVLSVRDNGIGFSENLHENSGMGLRIMNYRAKMIGASFDMSRSANGWTEVTCMLENSTIGI